MTRVKFRSAIHVPEGTPKWVRIGSAAARAGCRLPMPSEPGIFRAEGRGGLRRGGWLGLAAVAGTVVGWLSAEQSAGLMMRCDEQALSPAGSDLGPANAASCRNEQQLNRARPAWAGPGEDPLPQTPPAVDALKGRVNPIDSRGAAGPFNAAVRQAVMHSRSPPTR